MGVPQGMKYFSDKLLIRLMRFELAQMPITTRCLALFGQQSPELEGDKLAKPNYQYEKRQKDLEKESRKKTSQLRKHCSDCG